MDTDHFKYDTNDPNGGMSMFLYVMMIAQWMECPTHFGMFWV